jgi:hypothetical protein
LSKRNKQNVRSREVAAEALDSAVVARELAAAMALRGVGSRILEKRIRRLIGNERGTGYMTIESYRAGKVLNPRPYIIEALATALAVPAERLKYGRGPATNEDAETERLVLTAVDETLGPDTRSAIQDFADHFFEKASFALGATTTWMMFEVARDFAGILERRDVPSIPSGSRDLLPAFGILRDSLMGPIEALGLTPANDHRMRAYVRAMIFALELLPGATTEYRPVGQPDHNPEDHDAEA